ncbi:MAG TPA: hypothetical protein VFY49_18075 [Myxococcota bacterium]|nr:hypothetical protein [Myxococcota bacterium]
MGWKLSRFRVGDLVEVRSKAEILATLDAHGRLDGMPLMPEMLALCGRQFRVRAVAHKTCDTAKQSWTGRRLEASVHLEGGFCDGSAHGGCQAECTLFWRDAWLKRVGETGASAAATSGAACSEEDLQRHTRRVGERDPEVRYACQATELLDFTAPLSTWDVRQYWYDVRTGNRSASAVLRVLVLAWLRWLLPRVPLGYRVFKWIHERAHIALTGRPSPYLEPGIPAGQRTPSGVLDLRPGELVRIKSQAEIQRTLDPRGRNRGLSFDPQEMAPHCNRVVRVRKLVTRIIDEPTGKMLEMKQSCVMLDGVFCRSEYANRRLNCPRAIPSYWREIWLERVGGERDPDRGETQ